MRHLALKPSPAGPYIVWWYGAVRKNKRAKSLPLAVVWFRRLLPNGTLSGFFSRDVGINELGLLQVGTIWEDGVCKSRVVFEEHVFDVDFTRGQWRITSQRQHVEDAGSTLIPPEVYALPFARDRSELLVFQMADGKELLVPCVEFFSRYCGKSGHVTRVLATYEWAEAQPRLYLPFEYDATPGHWPIKLASSTYNADAVFLAHVKYDPYAMLAAKSVYSRLDAQYGPKGDGIAFLTVDPWFKGPAKLIVQGHWLDESRLRFLAVRIEGGSEPKGADISAFRENGKAEDPAPDGAPESRWKGKGAREMNPDIPGLVVNLTPDDEPGQNGDIVAIHNPVFRIVGPRREVISRSLGTGKTRPGKPTPQVESDKHSGGERHGSGGETGYASLHTETTLQSSGAVLDVWEGLRYLREKHPALVTGLAWYSADRGCFIFDDSTPRLVALKPFDEKQKEKLTSAKANWPFLDPLTQTLRGVLIAFVTTTSGPACLLEVDRRRVERNDGTSSKNVEAENFCGLVLKPPPGAPGDWLPSILDAIRNDFAVMKRVMNHCPPGTDDYKRSSSPADKVAGHSTVVNALEKVGIKVPKPRKS